MTPAKPTTTFQLGEWRVYPDRNQLQSERETVRLEPRLMALLMYLCSLKGRTASRENLLDVVWQGEHVSDHALHRAVSKLRKALDGELPGKSYIETIPKTGYRLLIVPKSFEPVKLRKQTQKPLEKRGIHWTLLTLIIGLPMLWIFWPILFPAPISQAPSASDMSPNYRFRPLTSLPGYEADISWRPWSESWVFRYVHPTKGGEMTWDLWQSINENQPKPLTNDLAREKAPAWSPDGQYLAYIVQTDDDTNVRIIDANDETNTRTLHLGALRDLDDLHWHPSKDALFCSGRQQDEGPTKIFLRYLDQEEVQLVTKPPKHSSGDRFPVPSPNGEYLAFVRFRAEGIGDLFQVNLTSGVEEQLTYENQNIQGLMWLENGDLLFSSDRHGDFALYRFIQASGRVLPVLSRGRNATGPKPARFPGEFVYESWQSEINVLRIGKEASSRPIMSTFWDWQAVPSPEGAKLAFLSNRSGATALWLAEPNRGSVKSLIQFDRNISSRIVWHPKDSSLYYAASSAGQFDLYRFTIGEPSQQLTRNREDERIPTVSPDGRWLYFTINQGGTWNVRRIPSQGGPSQTVIENGYATRFDPTGNWLFFTRQGQPGLWRAEPDQPSATLQNIVPDFPAEAWNAWDVSMDSVIFLKNHGNMQTSLRFLDFNGKEQKTIPLKGEIYPRGGLNVEANGTIWLAVIDKSGSDLWLATQPNRRK